MGYPIRWYKPGAVYEVTTRTIREQHLLRPCAKTRDLILGIIGRALCLYPMVSLYTFAFLSNHMHMLLSSTDGESVARFVGYVNGNIAREIGRFRKSPGRLWGRRMRPIEVLDDAKLVERFMYIAAQGCTENLVASPRHWPGASAVPGLLGDMRLEGTWHDHDGKRAALRKKNAVVEPGEFEQVYTVELTPLPVWAALSPEALRARHEAIIAGIERVTAERHAREGTRPLGVKKVLAQDPFARPAKPKCSPAPLCHASTKVAFKAYRAAYEAYIEAYYAASEASRAGQLDVEFPPCSFPSPRRFVAPRAAGTTGGQIRTG